MWLTVSGFLVLLVAGVAVLPVPRVRRLLLTAATRLGQAVLLAFLGACGTFFVQPDIAPAWLASTLAPLLEGIRGAVPDLGPASRGLPWLLLAVSAVLIALPVLIALELAVGLSRQTSLVHALHKELRLAAAWIDGRLFALGLGDPPPISREANAAAEVFRTASRSTPAADGSHVLDLMK